MSLTVIFVLLGGIVLFVCYCIFRLKQAQREIDALFKERQQLEAEKAVAETQVKHFEVRKKHEENVRHTDRTAVLDRLQQSGDLRD